MLNPEARTDLGLSLAKVDLIRDYYFSFNEEYRDTSLENS